MRGCSFKTAFLAVFSGLFLVCAQADNAAAQSGRMGSAGMGLPGQQQKPPSGESALPDAGEVNERAPGLALPIGDEAEEDEIGAAPQKTQEQIESEIRQEAFNAALMGLLPMEPDEIRKTLERFDRTREAAETPIYPYPNPEVVVKNISLDPGTMPPTMKLATGHVTTINVLDVTGAPWPIQDVTWAGDFEIIEPGEGSHAIRITPMSEFAYGNMSITLVNLITPITVILRTYRDGVFYRVDMRLPEYGPYAKTPLIEGGISISAGTTDATSILDGMPPQDAVKLDVSGTDGRTSAYRIDSTTYVRTPHTLLSPAWTGSIRSGDGTNVYVLGNTPVLLLSDQGRMIHVRLSEKETDE